MKLAILALVLLILPVVYAQAEGNCCVICDADKCCNAPVTEGVCSAFQQCFSASLNATWTFEPEGSCNLQCTNHEVPEFGTVTALVALAGATTGYFVFKKK